MYNNRTAQRKKILDKDSSSRYDRLDRYKRIPLGIIRIPYKIKLYRLDYFKAVSFFLKIYNYIRYYMLIM